MKIYTGTGDHGETGLLGGVRVSKNHLAICAGGDLDETNCCLGLVLVGTLPKEIRAILSRIQHDLFVLGSQVAACQGNPSRAATLAPDSIKWLESSIDQADSNLPKMEAFILPGGVVAGAQLHVARSVCRRAERSVVALSESTRLTSDLSDVVVYLNRLSDLLFVLARKVNLDNDCPETKWLPD